MREHTQRLIASTTIALAVMASARCSKRDAATNAQPSTSTPASQAAPAAAPQTTKRTACAMVTAAEMSTILSTTVGAQADEGNGTTACRYQPSGRSMPYVELKVDWGNGSVAMVSTRMMGRLEPGMANPLAGLGDEASAIGPALMVRTGEDLVNLTMIGVDDNVAIAKRILGVMRPRMGPSAQAQTPNAHGSNPGGGRAGDSATDATRVGEVVGGLLAQLAKDNQATSRSGVGGTPDISLANERTFGPMKNTSIRVPLVAGLTLVAAQHEPDRGDYEPMVTVTQVTRDVVSTVFSANLPEGTRLVVDRDVRREDLQKAREYRPWYEPGDPRTFPGTTDVRVSAAVYADLKTTGKAEFTLVVPDDNPLLSFVAQLSGKDANVPKRTAVLQRIEPHALAFPVLLNDEAVELPVIHARGTFKNEAIDFYVLDDPENPLVLLWAGGSAGRFVRIAFPTPDAARLEEKLKKDARVELHGIYFDFGKATIRPESEPVLREIASALTHNPGWKIGIEGHTDNIGGDTYNLDLSRRRADAVKQALVDRYKVPAATLTTAGFGASRPNASNDTLSGRARNRRVELVRQ